MSCYHPLKGFVTGQLTDKGKKEIFISSHDVDTIPYEKVVKKFGHDYKYDPAYMRLLGNSMVFYNSIEIPCGHCIGCRLDYSLDWAMRVICEASQFDFNYFVTLTYDDSHLPKDGKVSKRDLQLFNKKLRNKFGDGVRFFGCGEYGSKYLRPHYHVIYFNLPLNDLVPFGKNREGDNYFVSQELSDLWNKGFVLVADVSLRSAAYVARYSMKGLKNTLSGYEPFLLMSRRPGIGSNFVQTKIFDIYSTDHVYLKFDENKKSLKPNRYFDSQLEKKFPDLLEQWKEIRRYYSEIAQTSQLANSPFYDVRDLRDELEKRKEDSAKRLKRMG